MDRNPIENSVIDKTAVIATSAEVVNTSHRTIWLYPYHQILLVIKVTHLFAKMNKIFQ